MKKSLESLKSTKFENKQLSTLQTQKVKGGDAYCTGPGFSNYHQKDYKGDCCNANGLVTSYDFYV